MSATLAHIVRHPIKAVGHEELARGASRRPGGRCRSTGSGRWRMTAPRSAPIWPNGRISVNFLRGVAGPELMAVSATSDPAARRVTLSHPRAGSLTVTPDAPADAARLIDWLAPLWPEGRPAPAFVASVPGQAMTDWPNPFVSILNLGSNRALGERLGQALSIHRWRGNLWLDGLDPFAEFDLIGRCAADRRCRC